MAIYWDILKTHYLQASQATQLNHLALNLARIYLLAESGSDEAVVQHLIRESQFFIEWAVPQMDWETEMTFSTELVDLQRLLSRWKLRWSEVWTHEQQRREISTLAQRWCDRILQNCYNTL